MILVVSLNPAIDRTVYADNFIPYSVNRLSTVKRYAGGKGVNVASVICQLGSRVTVTGFVGGVNGQLIEHSLTELGAQTEFVHTNCETRENINIVSSNNAVTELLESGGIINDGEVNLFLTDFERRVQETDIVVMSGSLPGGVGCDFYYRLVCIANKYKKKVILDTGAVTLKAALPSKPFMIKPNQNELSELAGKNLSDKEEIISFCKGLVKDGIKNVIVSLGEKGFIHCSENKTHIVNAVNVKAVNTVGCGDSLVAACAIGFDKKMPITELLAMAAGVSVSNAVSEKSADINIAFAEEIARKTIVKEYSDVR